MDEQNFIKYVIPLKQEKAVKLIINALKNANENVCKNCEYEPCRNECQLLADNISAITGVGEVFDRIRKKEEERAEKDLKNQKEALKKKASFLKVIK